MKILIKNGRVVDPSLKLDNTMDLLVADGKIAVLSEKIRDEKADTTLDVNGMIVAPGLIDIHVHLREPGFEYKEDILSGARAAVAGGFTAVACMPNTDPPNDDPSVTKFIIDKADYHKLCRVYPVACATKEQKGEELTEMGLLKDAGAVAFSDDGLPIHNGLVMRRALEYSVTFDMPIAQHAEDPDLCTGGQMHDGPMSGRIGLQGMPATGESAVVYRDISLAALTGGHIHIQHVSTQEAMQAIEDGKSRGIRVTCEVTPHHLLLTDEQLSGYDTHYKMKPPLRTEDDRKYLLKALKAGHIDCIASDHAPHHADEKDCPFADAAFGIVGLETTLPLVIDRLVKPGIVTLPEAINLLSTRPASLFHLPGGTLRERAPADIVIFSTHDRFEVNPDKFFSKGRNTPFSGWKLDCRVHATIVGGRIVYQHG